MKPYVICHMNASVDGRILGSRWRPAENRMAGLFERLHEQLGGGSWLIGRDARLRDNRLRIMLIRIDEAARRRCGNPACAGQPQDDRARHEVFFSGAITSALGQHASAVRPGGVGAGGIGKCDVKSMLASTRTIAHQCRRRAEAH